MSCFRYFEAKTTKISDLETANPNINFILNGEENVLTCDFVGGCDGESKTMEDFIGNQGI